MLVFCARWSRVISGHGCVVGVAGPAGIGKSRLVSETAAIASSQGIEVFGAFCESHTKDLPFHVVARLLRAVSGIGDLEDGAARAVVEVPAPLPLPQPIAVSDRTYVVKILESHPGLSGIGAILKTVRDSVFGGVSKPHRRRRFYWSPW